MEKIKNFVINRHESFIDFIVLFDRIVAVPFESFFNHYYQNSIEVRENYFNFRNNKKK